MSQKPLFQAFFSTLVLERAFYFCIKISRNIDPPYNTGKDFVYEDDFVEETGSFLKRDEQYDEQGYRLTRNLDSNGRFHTDWLNMMISRLKLAKDLLRDDGVIFISIDDNEVSCLRKMCDEIFGLRNFIATIIWERAFSPVNLMKHFSTSHDYCLVYAKSIENPQCYGLARTNEADNRYSNPDNDKRGVWSSSDISVGPAVESNIYKITTPTGRVVEPPAGRSWSLSEKAFSERLRDNRIWFGEDGNSVPRIKRFLTELRKEGITPTTVWKFSEVGHSQEAKKKLNDLFDGKALFDYPKSLELIKRMISLYTKNTDLILDFFSGSSTTAHAVMQLNAEDGGKRKFIMVQLPEVTEETSEAYKAGYQNICEIGKERIRRAGTKIKSENPLTTADLDTGFRVLKLDSSNMKDVYYNPSEYTPDLFNELTNNIKQDRTPEDLLFQVMLELGIELSSKIVETSIAGKKVFNVAEGFLLACFDESITDQVITEIAKQKPYYFVMRDSSLADDSVAANFDQIFDTYCSKTIRKVL